MSRDWTPRECYEVEKYHIAKGEGDIWDSMRNVTWHPKGEEPVRLYSDEDIALRQQYPYLGKYLGNFLDLFGKIADFDDGLDFLKQKDAELGEYIENGKGDREGYLAKWFEGELVSSFHYREPNDELLVARMCEEAMLSRSNWCLTDPDCLQCRRQVGFEAPGVFELVQVDKLGFDDRAVYKLAWAQIDLDDYTGKERNSILNSYGYEKMSSLVSAAGSRSEAYGQLAEMIFETEALENYVQEFQSWNEALDEVHRRTGVDLEFMREKDSELDKAIVSAETIKTENKSNKENINKNRSEGR